MHLLPETTDGSTQDTEDHNAISRILLSAYPDSICKRREEGGGRFIHVQGRGVRLSLDSHLGSCPYIIAVHAMPVKDRSFVIWLPVTDGPSERCANLIKAVRWMGQRRQVVAAVEARLVPSSFGSPGAR
jgi:hypothetical protein